MSSMNPMNYVMAPMVITRGPGNSERAMDIYSRMLDDRVIFMFGGVDDNMAQSIVAQLLFLDSQGNDDVHLYINSPGGVVTAGLAISDAMDSIKSDVATYCLGQCASMGSYLAQYGAAGKRFVAPWSRTMIHDPSGGAQGIWSDMKNSIKEMERIREALIAGYVRKNSVGRDKEWFEKSMERDYFMSAQEAIDNGLADHIITPK